MALGTGSGVDIKTLAENLVNAEKQPKTEIIQKGIDKAKARITGYDVVARAIGQVKDALAGLANPSTFSAFTSVSSQPSAVTIAGGSGALAGSHEISVTRLAAAQRSISGTFMQGSPVANAPLSLDFTIAGAPKSTLTVTDTTPEGIVKKINDQGWSVKARLVNTTGATGGPIRIVLNGETGAANAFSLAVSNAHGQLDLGFTPPGSSRSTTFTPGVAVASSPITVNLSSAGWASPLAVAVASPATPEAISAAINAQQTEVKASVLNTTGATGGPVRLQISRADGSSETVSVSVTQAISSSLNLGFVANAVPAVSDAFASGNLVAPGTVFLDIAASGGVSGTSTVTVNGPATPGSLASAITAQHSEVSATLTSNLGDTFGTTRIELTNLVDSSQPVTVAARTTQIQALDLGFSNPASLDQLAQDALLTVDGLTITRPTNAVTGVLEGATITLTDITGANPAVVSLSRDTAPVKEKIKQLVSNYNDLQAIIDAATSVDSKVEGLGASLAGDSTVRGIRNQVRKILMPLSGSSNGGINASGSSSISGLRDLGIVIDKDGTMKFAYLKPYDATNPTQNLLKVGDETGLNEKLTSSFDDVAALFQGKNGTPGIAQDMVDQLGGDGRYMDTSFTPSSPLKLISSIQRSASGTVRTNEDRLAALEVRMKALLDRYMKQFAVMDSLVGQSKALQSSVESSFKGMSNSR